MPPFPAAAGAAGPLLSWTPPTAFNPDPPFALGNDFDTSGCAPHVCAVADGAASR